MAKATRSVTPPTPREIREAKGLTLVDAAAASGLAINTVRAIESGAESVNLQNIEDLARVYGLTRMELLEACERARGAA